MRRHAGRILSSVPPSLAGVLALSAVLNVAGVWWGLPSPRGWAPDELLPADVLAGLNRRFSGGWFDRYPPVHYYLLSVIYLPIVTLAPKGADGTVGPTTYFTLFLVGRLVSVAMGVATIAVTHRLARKLYGERAAIGAALVAASSVPFVYYAKMANVDVPALFWLVLSLIFYVRVIRNGAPRDHLLLGATAALAVCTKDQMYGFYVLPAVHVAMLRFQRSFRTAPAAGRRPSIGRLARVAADPTLIQTLVVVTVIFVVAHNLAFNLRGFQQHLADITGTSSQDYRMFASTPAGHAAMFGQAVRQMGWSLGWPAFALAVLGLLRAWKDRQGQGPLAGVSRTGDTRSALWLLLPVVSYYVFFIALVGYHYDRFFLGVSVVLAVFAGRELAAWTAPGRRASIRWAGAAAAAVTVWYGASIDIWMVADSRYQVERWMRERIQPTAVVATTTHLEYMPRVVGFQWVPITFSNDEIDLVQPDYIIVNDEFLVRFDGDSPQRQAYTRLRAGRSGYRLALDHRSDARWSVLSWLPRFRDGREDLFTNLDKVNPRILVFARKGE